MKPLINLKLSIVTGVALIALFFFTDHAYANTFYIGSTNDVLVTVNLPSGSTYNPGASIQVDAFMENLTPAGTGVDYPISLTVSNNSGNPYQIIPTTILAAGQQTQIHTYVFTVGAPSVPGTYPVDFVAGIDEFSTPTTALSGFNAGQGWTNIGTHAWEASASIASPSSQDEVVAIRFDYVITDNPCSFATCTSGSKTLTVVIPAGSTSAIADPNLNEINPSPYGADTISVNNICVESHSPGIAVNPVDEC